MTYKIPFTYTVNAVLPIDAVSLEDALNRVEEMAGISSSDGYCKLIHGFSPIIKTSVDTGSIRVDRVEAEELNPKRGYTVSLKKIQIVEVYVEAHSASEAEETAIEVAESGDETNMDEIDTDISVENVELIEE